MSGHNDYEEFEIDDGENKTSWTRVTSETEGSDISRREKALLYKEGHAVILRYVEQRFKKPIKGFSDTSRCVLEIEVDTKAQPEPGEVRETSSRPSG
jgi:hypothetical protein